MKLCFTIKELSFNRRTSILGRIGAKNLGKDNLWLEKMDYYGLAK